MKQKLLLISFLLFSFVQTTQGLSNYALGFCEGLVVNGLLTKYGASGKTLTCAALAMLLAQRCVTEKTIRKGSSAHRVLGSDEKLQGSLEATALYFVGCSMFKRYIDVGDANYLPHYMGLTIFTMLLDGRRRLYA